MVQEAEFAAEEEDDWFERTDTDRVEYEDDDCYVLKDCAVIWSKSKKCFGGSK